MAGVFLATDDVRRQFERIGELERKVDDLYSLFVADARRAGDDLDPAARDPPAAVVALPAGSSYHRPACSLVAGKADVTDGRRARDRQARTAPVPGLRPGTR